MTSEQVEIVQSTWPKLLRIEETAARIFYRRLFEMDPSLKPMFVGDIEQQGRKLMRVLDYAVNGLSHLESMLATLRELGLRHVGYGVKAHHYGTVGRALIWTLERGLAGEFTPAVREAWAAAYRILATAMQESAAAHSAARYSASIGR